ncbi:hypothetical protein COV49_03290 [Candidatus Falkowbacteria bacterium CG11_big_fil_rev_8_21_14_0_20_39_10]|uniref:Uncharacterized protein n=1 Tax=Candidatus Falkowbacteria bacterium CG11_big_fil_rev_8_21_14_0_20_39_10 TaxID=1974570 RepID=A0A2M6K8E2_9BACT|nr:MAG: hypothetical protein COV49_03290 [Candidatus Falkowbacteria bacterium CG11_big_fil_rev_8_21_14_0_20_39_10]
MVQADTIGSGVDERLLAGELGQQKQAAKQGEAQREVVQEASLRERQMAARQEEAKQKEKEAAGKEIEAGDTVKSKLKDKILNGIPFYNSYRALKSFFGDKKIKFDIVDTMILVFTNIELILVIFGALAIFILVAYIYENPTELLKAFGLGAVYSALKALF